jgi:CHASE1-domain containing sensor protein
MTLPEAGKIIEGMKGTPALLAVIVLQLATLMLIYVVATNTADRQQARELALIEACTAALNRG